MPGMDETSLRRLLDSALVGRPPMGPVAHNALRAGLKLRRRRRIQGATGGAAAIAIIAVTIPATIGILGHTPGPAAGQRPAGLAGGPKFFAGVAEKPRGQDSRPTVVNIYRSATGRVVASIRPPRPYHDFVAVSRLGGDRTFVAAAITAFSPTACTSHLFKFGIDGRGHPSGLTPLSVPQVTTGQVAELVSSANGKALAYTVSGCATGLAVGMINLATGQTTTWTVPYHGIHSMISGSLSLTADGSRLGFAAGPSVGIGPTNAYVLPTDSPPGPLMRHATKVLHVPTGVFRVVLSNNGSQAYVETQSAPHTGAVVLSQYNTATGQRVRLLGQLHPGGRFPGLSELSVTVDASGKHLLAYSDAHRVTAVDLTTGHQASITAAQIPYLDAAYNTAAW
jgi:hypothetical protein